MAGGMTMENEGGSPHLSALGTQGKSLRLQIAFKGLLGADKT